MIKKFNHVGIAVRNLDTAVEFFQEIYGAKLVWRKKFNEQKTESALISIGEAQLELSAGLEPKSVIDKFIDSRGEGIHHVGFQIEDMDAAVAEFARRGITPIFHHDMGVMDFAYFDTSEFGGLMVEFLHWKKTA